MGFLLEFDYESGGLRFWLLGFDKDDDEKEVFFTGLIFVCCNFSSSYWFCWVFY